jgi:peptidyl-prolyl cis-trans isomerase D
VPDAGGIIAAGFEAQPGVERDAVEMPDGGFTWVDLQGIIEPKQKPFEEVKAAVETAWMEAEKRKALTELATKLVERINKGETLSQIANEVGGKPDTAIAITRKTLPQGLTQGAVGQAFALPKGGAGSAETADGKSRILFKVVDIKPAPPPTKDQAERITKEIRSQDEGDTLAAYVAALQTRLGVSVDETVLRRTLGTDRQ